jgi:hypothetical protein
MTKTTREVKKMKEKEQYFPGSVIDIKDEGEESAETYKNSFFIYNVTLLCYII